MQGYLVVVARARADHARLASQEISAIKETHASKATDELRSFAQHYAELEASITADSGRRAEGSSGEGEGATHRRSRINEVGGREVRGEGGDRGQGVLRAA